MILGLKTPIKVFVREKFISDRDGLIEGLIIAITCEQSRQPTFTVLLADGAKYDPIPVHAICREKSASEMMLHDLAWWDCLSDEFNIEVIPTLMGMCCEFKNRSGKLLKGSYVLSIKFKGGWADLPSEHKVFDLISLHNGNYAWTINNKTRYLDESFVSQECKGYNRNQIIWRVE
jgi:hypothetical protein